VGGGAHGETPPHRLGRQMEKPQINENNIHVGVNWPPIGKSTHDNQPKEVICNRGEYVEGA
jgi:hypothetical protein